MTGKCERSESVSARLVAISASACCLLFLVSGLLPQLEMQILGGRVILGSVPVKLLFVACLATGCLLNPRLRLKDSLAISWLALVLFLIFEAGYLVSSCGVTLENVFGAYDSYYFLVLAGVPLLIFGFAISEKALVRAVVVILLICAALGLAQYLTVQPLLRTVSADGSFEVFSWDFFGQVRAFSLFTSPAAFGEFCSLTGALGVALSKSRRKGGLLLLAASAVACYTTLTRMAYLEFLCACAYAFILTFGNKPRRGLWQPMLFFALGIGTILAGVKSVARGNPSGLQDSSSLLLRIDEWTYSYGLLSQASFQHQLFGLGILQSTKFSDLPIIIDNTPLALLLHIGFVGFLLFNIYFVLVWLHLRREAISSQQPFAIAAASFWSTIVCAGTFGVVFQTFGAVFALAILCRKGGDNSANGTKSVPD